MLRGNFAAPTTTPFFASGADGFVVYPIIPRTIFLFDVEVSFFHGKGSHDVIRGRERGMTSTDEGEIPKLPLIVAFGVLFGVLPMLPHGGNNGTLARLVDVVYRRVGGFGLVAIPLVTLTMEKIAYDTYTAYHGASIYEDTKKTPYGGFPSGGAQLPSFSLVRTRREGEPVEFRFTN